MSSKAPQSHHIQPHLPSLHVFIFHFLGPNRLQLFNYLSLIPIFYFLSFPLLLYICILSSFDKYSRLLLLTGFMFFYLYLTRKSCCVENKLRKKNRYFAVIHLFFVLFTFVSLAHIEKAASCANKR